MFIIEVVPFLKGGKVESLTYYSSEPYEIGSVVTIPVRKKEARAMVVKQEPVSAAKTAVRAATFSLRKLPAQTKRTDLPPLLLETAKQLMKEVPASLSAILFALLPKEVREGQVELNTNLPCLGEQSQPKVSVLQADESERLRAYRSQVREAFAHRGSVLLVVPTAAHIDKVKDFLARGIDDRVITLTGNMSENRLKKAYHELADLSHAKLIITTPARAFVDRPDITHIIIDRSRSQDYKARTRPYIDWRDALLKLGKISGRDVILGDLLPRTEDEFRRQTDRYQTLGEHPKRLNFPGRTQIVRQRDRAKPTEPFKLISNDLKREIEFSLRKKGPVFIYSARRGLAPVVACGDCGHIFRCPHSGSPYSLLRIKKPPATYTGETEPQEERWFMSSVSGRRVRAADVCPDCGSWRLRERGIGIQQVEDELREALPDCKLFVFDHTTVTTARQARTLAGKFYEAKGAIMLGTTMALPYLDRPVALSAVVSTDAARSIPSWRADEEFFSLLLHLREISSDMVLVQTRTESDDILKYFKTGQVEQFYKDELALRETLSYPPFSKLIHLTIAGKPAALKPLENEIKEWLKDYQPKFYSAPHSTPKETVRYGLIRVTEANWPNDELIKKLRSLPPMVRVEVNPARIV